MSILRAKNALLLASDAESDDAFNCSLKTSKNIVGDIAIRLSWIYVPQLTAVLPDLWPAKPNRFIRAVPRANRSRGDAAQLEGHRSATAHSAGNNDHIIQALPLEIAGLELREGAALRNEVEWFGQRNSRVQRSFWAEISAEGVECAPSMWIFSNSARGRMSRISTGWLASSRASSLSG
jgi:hypothetical protein